MTGLTEILQAIFDTLLPGDDLYPPAGSLSLGGRAGLYPHFAPMIEAVLTVAPPGFEGLEAEARIAWLSALEGREPVLFAALVTTAYSLYYSDKVVLRVIAEAEGYTPRAPQPEGYALDAFDAAAVGVPARHAPSWRQAEASHD